MLNKLFFVIIISVIGCNSHASFNDTLIAGIWKGTSICQKKNSPCHDENVVFHLIKGDKPGIYQCAANKIVNGAEEEMGVLDFTYDATSNTLTHVDKERDSIWKFNLKNNTMEGTLYSRGELYRIVKLTREK